MFAPFQRYFDVWGRSRRKEYWLFVLFIVVVDTLIRIFERSLMQIFWPSNEIEILAILFGIFTFIPSLTVSIRRLHDTDRSGWWLLVGFVPIVGWIWLIE